MKTGFDNEKYLRIQSEQIKKRIAQFGDKLYLEFGGKANDMNADVFWIIMGVLLLAATIAQIIVDKRNSSKKQ